MLNCSYCYLVDQTLWIEMCRRPGIIFYWSHIDQITTKTWMLLSPQTLQKCLWKHWNWSKLVIFVEKYIHKQEFFYEKSPFFGCFVNWRLQSHKSFENSPFFQVFFKLQILIWIKHIRGGCCSRWKLIGGGLCICILH